MRNFTNNAASMMASHCNEGEPFQLNDMPMAAIATRMPQNGFRPLYMGTGTKFHLPLGTVKTNDDGVSYREFVYTSPTGSRTTFRIWGDREYLLKSRDIVGTLEIFVSLDNKQLVMHLDSTANVEPVRELAMRTGPRHMRSRGAIQSKIFPGVARSYEIIDLNRLCCNMQPAANDPVEVETVEQALAVA